MFVCMSRSESTTGICVFMHVSMNEYKILHATNTIRNKGAAPEI